MTSPDPKNDMLWFSIAQFIYSGLIAYAIVVVLAIIRDFSRSNSIDSTGHTFLFILLHWYYRFSVRYRDTNVFYYVEILRLLSNFVICVLYVLGTYQRDVPLYTMIVYRVFGTIFAVDLLFYIMLAESAVSSATRVVTLIEAFSLPSLFLPNDESDYLNFACLRAVAAFLAYARLERRMFVHIFSQNRLLVKLFLKILTLFYTLAALIQLFEIPGDLLSVKFREDWADYGDWNFMNSAYFIIVTLSTVGYGDYSPSTVQGRLYTLLIIIIGIIVFTSVVSDLVEQANRDPGAGYFVKNIRTRHVIVTGNPNISDLVHFVTEYYSDSRQSNVSSKIVVMGESPRWTEMEWFQYIARNQFLQTRLQYITGSALNPRDLHRSRISTADAVFMLTSPSEGKDLSLQDTTTTLSVLAIRNIRSDIPIYAQTLLEDSNLQSYVALSTVSSRARVASFNQAQNESEKCARYVGLFESVLMSELHDLPLMHQGIARRYKEHALNQHKERIEAKRIHHDHDVQAEALSKSQIVCLQEIQMALITGNIKANGVGTLLSNMFLDVQPPKLSKEDPGWTHEYLIGATAGLTYTIVPDELDGACIKIISNDMFHLGLLVIATSDPIDVLPRPVLSTNETLRSGDLVMILSYHERIHVADALCLVALRYSQGELLFAPQHENDSRRRSHNDPRSSTIPGVMAPNSNSSLSPKPSWREEQRQDTPPFLKGPPPSHSWIPSSLSRSRLNVSADDLDALAAADEDVSENGNLLEDNEGVETKKLGESYIPDDLMGHIIVAMDGDAPIQNLPLFLRNLWHKDNRRAQHGKKRARVIVVHPSISEDVRKRFERFERISLFFLEGSPASRATWRKAKLGTAAAVAILADMAQQTHVTDARTIFTMLTLDVSTANDQNLFICSELIDEHSLEYLREPTHPRRRGAELGEPSDRPNPIRVRSSSNPNLSPTSDNSPNESNQGATIEHGNGNQPRSSRSRIITFNENGEVSQDFMDEELVSAQNLNAGTSEGIHRKEDDGRGGVTHEPERKNMKSREHGDNGAKSESHTGKTFSRLSSKNRSRQKHHSKVTSKGPLSMVSTEAKSVMAGLGPEAGAVESLEIGADPSFNPGATRARRSTLFSRSRYASGELLVQSSAITLLAREYIEPGFVTFFTNILGTDTSHPGMKIRLVRIPKALFDPSRGYTCKLGRPLVRYNDVFQILVALGVTPIGIYRSGSAPVLIPWKMRRKRGVVISQELEPMLERSAQESGALQGKGESLPFSDILGGMLKKVLDLNPSKQREHRDQGQVLGPVPHVSYDSDDSDTSVDEQGSEEENREVDDGQGEGGQNSERFQQGGSQNSNKKKTDFYGVRGKEKLVGIGTRMSNSGGKRFSLFNKGRKSKTSRKLVGGGSPNREQETSPGKFTYNTDPSLQVPGRAKYLERPVAENILPYVYTLPEPNTWCSETDGIFILCDPSFDLPSKWTETADAVGHEDQDLDN